MNTKELKKMNKNTFSNPIFLFGILGTVILWLVVTLITSLSSSTIESIDRINKRHVSMTISRDKNLLRFNQSKLRIKYLSYLKDENASKWISASNDSFKKSNIDMKRLLEYKEQNSRSDEYEISLLLNQMTININKYLEQSKKPMKFLEELNLIDENFEKIKHDNLNSVNNSMIKFKANLLNISQLLVNKYAIDINKTQEVLKKEYHQNELALNNLASFKETLEENTDILVMKRLIPSILTFKKISNNSEKRLNKYKKEINSSYMKTLIGMREEYFVTISSISWDDTYDYPSEHKIIYKEVRVTPELFDSVSKISSRIAVDYTSLFSSFKLYGISRSSWESFGIDSKYAFKRNRGDSNVEFYIESLRISYAQSFSIIENNKETKTGMINVSEAEYIKNYKNLGMTIISKPYGVLEQHADHKASPPGLSIAGNKHYTEERVDSSGNSFFYYYGIYSMFTGNHYSRNDIDHYYNRDRSHGYYRTGRGISYGTYSNRTSGLKRPSRLYSLNKLNRLKKSYSRSSSSRSSNTGSLRNVKKSTLSRSPKSGK